MRREREAGFSLLEMLVVLTLIATMAGVTMLSFATGDAGARPETEARLLANRLSLAADEALVTGEALSLALDATGYEIEFWSNESQGWAPHPGALFGARHDLPGGMRIETEPNLSRVAITTDATGAPTTIVLADSGGGWAVSHDGLVARAAPVDR